MFNLTFKVTSMEIIYLEFKSFTVVIQPLSIRLIKPNFCFDLSHRRSTAVSLETRNPLNLLVVCVCLFFISAISLAILRM